MENNKAGFLKINATENSKEVGCALCNHCLSVGPVLYSDFYGNICGRRDCVILAHSYGNISKQVVYESFAAQFLIFPCMYELNGCQAELKWGEVQEHENNCLFKYVKCLLSNEVKNEKTCDWFGENTSELLSHLEEEHSNHFFKNILKLNFNESPLGRSEIYFTKIQEDLVVILLDDVCETSFLCVAYAGASIRKFLKYCIEIFDENDDSSLVLQKSDLNLLYYNISKLKIRKTCLKVDFTKMKFLLQNPCSIIISLKYKDSIMGIPKDSPDNLCNSHKIKLEDVQCLLCRSNISSPMYVCSSGYHFCSFCQTKNCSKCLNCAKVRNIGFERIKLLQNEYCKYNVEGCSYIASYLDVNKHENICRFKEIKCITCDEKINNVLEHFKKNHNNKIRSLTQIFPMNLYSTLSHSAFFVFDNHIFRYCSINCDADQNFTFEVVCLGMNQLQYEYELCLSHKTFSNLQIKLCYVCYPGEITNQSEIESLKCIKIPHFIFKQIFPNGEFNLKLNIKKKTY